MSEMLTEDIRKSKTPRQFAFDQLQRLAKTDSNCQWFLEYNGPKYAIKRQEGYLCAITCISYFENAAPLNTYAAIADSLSESVAELRQIILLDLDEQYEAEIAPISPEFMSTFRHAAKEMRYMLTPLAERPIDLQLELAASQG